MPLPTSLVVKNGSKILSSTSGAMPMPHILDLAYHVIGRRQQPRPDGARLVLVEIEGADRQDAAIRHGIAGIDREIDDDLLELVDVDLDEPDIAAMDDPELDLLAEQPAKQIDRDRR